MIHKIQGKNVKQPIKHLNSNGQTISKLPDNVYYRVQSLESSNAYVKVISNDL